MRPLDHKIWGIAWPAILSNISIPLLGLVDAAILGHLGTTTYLGAVAIGGAILSFLYWGFNFLRMGTTGLVARAEGAGDSDGSLLILAQSAVLAIALALLVWLAHPLWLGIGIALMAPQDELLPLASSYASIRIISAPAVLLTYAVVGWFIGRQNTRWPMFIVVATNVCNIALDFLFIIGLGLQSDGAAMATVIAEYLGLGLAVYGVVVSVPRQRATGFYRKLRSWPAYKALLRSNRHLFVRTVCLLGSFAFFTAMGDKLGGDTLAANALMLQLLMLTSYAMDGFAFAAEGLSGNALGGRDLAGFQAATSRCALWCAVAASVMSLAFLLLHQPLFSLLTNLPSVRTIMLQHSAWLILLPLVAAPSYLLDGVFIGSAETRPMMLTMMFSALGIYLPVWYLTQAWGNNGLWLAFTLFNATRGITLFFYYQHFNRRGYWLRQAAATQKA
ncbi:MAG: MATE family efflux transporter [Halieaceae bacterium]